MLVSTGMYTLAWGMEFWLVWVPALWLMLLVVVGLRLLLVNESCGVLIELNHRAHHTVQCQASWLARAVTC